MFKRPVGFEPRKALPDFTRPSEPSDPVARVRFDADVAEVALRQTVGAAEVARDSYSVTFDLPVTSESAFIGWILAFDDKAVIVSPPELVDSFLRHVGVLA